jgi:hypothetical protein
MSKCIWAFILGVSVLDISFTWRCRTTLTEWESNPVASAIGEHCGAPAVVLYRVGWLGFAGLMARTKNRLAALVTPVWGMAHLYLLFALVQVLPFLNALAG